MDRTLLTLLFIITVAAVFTVPIASAQNGTLSTELSTELQTLLDDTAAQDSVVGMVLRVETPEGVFAGASGYADREAQTPLQPGDAFRIGSITKMFTATVTLQLAEEGVLDLDDLLSTWLPDVASQLPYGNQITLRHLLSHSSGLHDFAEDQRFIELLLSEPQQHVAPQQVIEFVVEVGEPHFEPGDYAHAAYSSTNYTLLGLVIEAATSESLTEAYHTRIFEPLGMAHTYLDGFEAPLEQPVHGYSFILADTGIDTTGWNFSAAWSTGGLVSTANDLARFAHALVDGALFTHDATLEDMLTFIGADEYGLGVERIGTMAWGHNGRIFGFSSMLAIIPQSDTIVILLANSDELNAGAISDAKNAAMTALLP